MDDYISRQAAIAVIYGQHVGGKEACENARPNTYGADLREIVADIEDIPPAAVRPVTRGKWEIHAYGLDGEDVYCSVCGCGLNLPHWNYCPICGSYNGGDDAE